MPLSLDERMRKYRHLWAARDICPTASDYKIENFVATCPLFMRRGEREDEEGGR